ncbi:LuxE/PaaK family acyltransferase [Aurantibacillus circumpalustris]|uniref:LuxE/PaaK family acyltransferase n=1 Tax=Aurantibacillus circumpalustris TaxID=3036359 RepID=UPI00295B3500|nr:acyl transferase [Aurantibacillus circumpalustris]
MLKNENTIFDIASEEQFLAEALSIFQFQYQNNLIYKKWTDLIKTNPDTVNALDKIPFLPIEFFKKFEVVSSPINSKTVSFTSSSTTSQVPATHYVNSVDLYKKSFLKTFELFYGDPKEYCILALLPNYLQRSGSSLVYMCKELIGLSTHPFSGFFLDNITDLISKINRLKNTNQKIILIGVSYALMDLCSHNLQLTDSFIVMETGGMKGARKEMLKPELHAFLKKGFKGNTIHSEYGMTELLSQAYSKKNGLFEAPPWMRFYTREVDDPLKLRTDHKTGGINVIDLANIYSCSFIATKDLGRVNEDGALELMGRYDHSDVRGCNLMMGDF